VIPSQKTGLMLFMHSKAGLCFFDSAQGNAMNSSSAHAASGPHAQSTETQNDTAAAWDLALGRTVLADIADPALTQALQVTLNNKTKPLGSLGRLEDAALKIGQILGSTAPALEQPQMVVFAGDHGLTARGISAFPSDVTWQMVENFLAGGAAVSVLAKQNGIALTVVDCGVKHDFLAGLPAGTTRPGLQVRKAPGAEQGTADSSAQPAMTAAQRDQALQHGMELVKGLPGNALLLGEMGIGNTSAASMLLSRLGDLDIAVCTGAGTGLDAPAVQRKTEVLREVLALHAGATAPLDALAALGGFEIATMVGAVLQAAHERRVIVVDGFIATSAIVVAHALQPLVLQRCVFAHRSGERGHEFMLQHLGVQALLDLGLRLGEGSGAALAWPLLQSACTILRDMASFASAGVSEKADGPVAVA
jgi:nicotinate-nucleotide--dimethylbenzimidazole phosphoribosyltransferase